MTHDVSGNVAECRSIILQSRFTYRGEGGSGQVEAGGGVKEQSGESSESKVERGEKNEL